MAFTKTFLKLTLITGVAVGFVTSTAHADFDFLEPAAIAERVKKEVAKQSIGANLNLVNAEIFEGISASLKYRIQSEPSYVDGYYTRLDRYTLGVNINPGDLIEDLDTPIGFSINKGVEIVFARQFKSQTESLTAIPYSVQNLPLTAHRALTRLNVGDFVAMQGRLNLAVSLGASSPLSPLASVSGSTHAYISGEFMIHLFRMPDNRMRVKLIGIRGRGQGAGAQVSFGQDFKVIGFSFVDNKIKNFVNLTPLALSLNESNSDLFMLDYVFDLNNAQAIAAYDQLLVKKTRFKDLNMISPFESRDEMRDKLLTDISEVEKISYEDRGLTPQERRIDRVFKGSNSSHGKSGSFKIGLNLLRLETGSAYAQNKIAHVDREENDKKYLLDTFSTSKNVKLIFGLFGDTTTISTNMLFSADDQWRPERFIALSLARDIKMKDVSARDYRKVQEHVRKIIPAKEYAKIDWKKWDFSKGSRVNGAFRNQLFFHPKAINLMPFLSKQKAYDLYSAFILKMGRPQTPPQQSGYDPEGQNYRHWIDQYESDLNYIATNLSVAFNPNYTASQRYEAFKLLKDFTLWQETAAGFLIYLLPPEQLGELMSYEMTFSAKGVDTISLKFGNFAQEELYNSLMYIQNVINNRSFDLRLYTDEKGEFKVK
ncbi:hypothetical protein [Bdellovibrio sp.]|uniref:hypothetical protein n=1 Tax=Bdellovibrio sp. TaxID=28201 RepID=UPI0039E2BE62